MPKPRCKICKKALKAPESLAKGIGPECANKWAGMLSGAGLTLAALNIPEALSTDPLVALSLDRAEKALLAGRRSDVEQFKAAARKAARELSLGFSRSEPSSAPIARLAVVDDCQHA
jgi:hypothetical protein